MTDPLPSARSVHQRLLNLARSSGSDFQALLVQFAIERFLYRLSISPHAERFVLKGATLFRVWAGELHRPTMDVDLLGYGAATTDAVSAVIEEVLALEAPEDALRFDRAVRAEEIRGGQEYGGVRVRCAARLGSARIPMQIDVGFGDAVHPSPALSDVPPLLGHRPPRLAVYPPEAVVAEKLEAIVTLDLANSRMKDFHDLRAIARSFEFDLETLRRAITATFERRGTALPHGAAPGLTDAFGADPAKQRQWTAFLDRLRLSDEPRSFRSVVADVAAFAAEPLSPAAPRRPKRWRPPSRAWR